VQGVGQQVPAIRIEGLQGADNAAAAEQRQASRSRSSR
jgi:hypothetical protein